MSAKRDSWGGHRGPGAQWAAALLAVVAMSVSHAIAQTPLATNNQSYQLVNTDAAQIGPQLTQLLEDYGAAAKVSVDRSQNVLFIQGSETDRQLAVQLIRTLDKRQATRVVPAQNEQPGTVRGYPVQPDQLNSLAEKLSRQFPQSMGVRIATDTRTSQLVVIATEDVHRQIETELKRTPNPPLQRAEEQPRRVPGVASDRLQLRHITWRQFEQQLQSLWGNNLTITPDAAGNMSSVFWPEDPQGLPIIRINRATNEISFSADDKLNSSWRRIAMALDRVTTTDSTATQLVPLRRTDPAKVREAITAIRDAASRTTPGDTVAAVPVGTGNPPLKANSLVSMIFQSAEGGEQSAPAQADGPNGSAPEGDGPSGDGPSGDDPLGMGEDELGLLGDVQIEFVPELGVFILRGNKRDVQRVQEIIDQIERESEVTKPEVQVVSLDHTNSEAMTEIVTQIYEDVYAPRQGSLSITALVKPNAILLVGRQENIDTANALIEKLDEPVAPDTQIKVFRLLHMPALNAEQYLQSFYGGTGTTAGQQQQQGARGLSARVVVIGDFRSNSLIVQASPRDLEEVSELLNQLDVDKTEASIEVRVFALQNSLASDMQTVLQNTLAGTTTGAGGQQQAAGATQSQVSRSVQIIGIDQDGNKIIESGLLNDVTFTADDNSNALVVKAPSQNMGLIAALVKQLDKIPAAESQIKVFQIKNGDATSLTGMLQTLFGQPVTAGQIGVFSQTVGRTFGATQTLSQTTAGESSLIPLNFGIDARTNSIIASGSRGDLAVVEAILLRLDEGDLQQRRLIVYRLHNAPAQQVADALRDILVDQQTLLAQQQSQQFSLISQFEYIDQQVFIVPEIISNSLIVSATPKYFEQISEVVRDLDRRPPMVMIQVVVCLVRLNDNEEMGVELGIQDSLLFDRSASALGLLAPGFDFVNKSLGNSDSPASLATRELLAGQAFGSYGVGRSGASGTPGLVLSASSESINILIRALVEKTRTQVLSRPQIMTLNNVPASVLVGQRIPQITDFQTTNSGSTINSVELVDAGVSLGVIPRVTPDGLVIMDLEVNDSRVGDPDEGIVIGASEGVEIKSPIYDDVTAITTIAARSGQTVVFGGLIQTNRADTFRGVPYLSQLPVLGHLFRYDTRTDQRTELIFFLTPHIVMDENDLEELNQREAERMSWCLADIIDAHGDPGFNANRFDPWSNSTPVIYPHLDPTAAGVNEMTGEIYEENFEQLPSTGDPTLATPPGNQPGSPPFILPSDDRPQGEPFILPSEQQTPGKPFILPPGQTPGEAKPFILPSGEPTPDNAMLDTSQQTGEMGLPRAARPPTPAQTLPLHQATAFERGYQQNGAAAAPQHAPQNSVNTVAPAYYQQPVTGTTGSYYPPPPLPPAYPTTTKVR